MHMTLASIYVYMMYHIIYANNSCADPPEDRGGGGVPATTRAN